MAEVILAAGVELHIGGQDVAVLVEERLQAAEVVVVAMTDDQRIDLGRINADQFHVVEEHGRSIAVVQHHRALLCAAFGFEPEGKAPLVVQ
jgi:hypothetical protein